MNGIILIDKEKDYTSRDVVNIISKCLNTKKVGHFGTLDPLATGLLIIGVGKYTKFQKVLDNENKEYDVEVLIGKSTNTYDITGEVTDSKNITIDEEYIKNNLLSFIGKYNQEVPIYSAVKVNGKKLYEYARNNFYIDLPKKEIEVFNINNISFKNNYLYFTCLVSKGTYIRSLINDLGIKTNIPMCMSNLRRTKINSFNVKDSYKIDDIKSNNYKFYDIDKLFNYKKVEMDNLLEKQVLNGVKLNNIYNEDNILFTKNNKLVALYTKDTSNKLKVLFYF